ncbi:MAG: gluconokinase [Gammaproteobacteria bacterium]
MSTRSGPRAFVIMGVSACGKTAVGKILAQQLGWAFLEGDTMHPQSNIAKMSAGIPLTDEDRRPWLDHIADWIAQRLDADQNCVVACSALRRIYRDRLRTAGEGVRFVYLKVPREILLQRMQGRKHFMPASLLDSQLDTLEEPGADENALTVEATGDINDTVAQIKRWI